MDSLSMNMNARPKYISQYFPPDEFVYDGSDNYYFNTGFLAGFAKSQVNVRVREGVLLIRLWSDVYEALRDNHQRDAYYHYLVWVRKITGRMIGEELDPDKARIKILSPERITAHTTKTYHDVGTSTRTVDRAPEVMDPTTKPSMQPTSKASATPVTPLANVNPQPTEFASPQPTKNDENKKPSRAEFDSRTARAASFEERCKKLGLRISSGSM